MGNPELLTGAEYVLVAQVPKAGDRWHQVHFNVDVGKQFFRVNEGEDHLISLEQLRSDGQLGPKAENPLVFSKKNRNYRIEFDFKATDYPEDDRPLLLVLELGLRRFRYVLLLPGDDGYDEMATLNADEPSIGQGVRRVLTNLDEVELRWPGCPLRGSPASELDA